jgi:hypothetical protein
MLVWSRAQATGIAGCGQKGTIALVLHALCAQSNGVPQSATGSQPSACIQCRHISGALLAQTRVAPYLFALAPDRKAGYTEQRKRLPASIGRAPEKEKSCIVCSPLIWMARC